MCDDKSTTRTNSKIPITNFDHQSNETKGEKFFFCCQCFRCWCCCCRRCRRPSDMNNRVFFIKLGSWERPKISMHFLWSLQQSFRLYTLTHTVSLSLSHSLVPTPFIAVPSIRLTDCLVSIPAVLTNLQRKLSTRFNFSKASYHRISAGDTNYNWFDCMRLW